MFFLHHADLKLAHDSFKKKGYRYSEYNVNSQHNIMIQMASSSPSNDLNEKSACELLNLINNGDIGCVELLHSCIKRYEQINHSINAVVETNFDEAIEVCKELDSRTTKEFLGPKSLPLPIGIKDLNDVKGMKTSYGSPLFKDNIANEDDDVVSSLRDYSAVIFGKTNVPEHGFGATTTNPLQGSTGNPFNPKLSAGASTGGGAAAVASGIVPLATGSDFAGSLRTPAGFCGIAGMRPSNGVVATNRRSNIWSPFDVEGPMGRTAADCKLLLARMAKSHPLDPFSQQPEETLFLPTKEIDLKTLKVAISHDLGFAVMSNTYKDIFYSKIGLLDNLFDQIKRDHMDLSKAEITFMTLRSIGFLGDFGLMEKDFGDELGEVIIKELEIARQLSSERIAQAFLDHSEIVRKSNEFFETFDLLITPAASVTPFAHELEYPSIIDEKFYKGYLDWEAISWGITLTQCPSVVINCGLDTNGMPFGIQIIAKQKRDGFLLDAAHSIEKAFLGIEDLSTPFPNLEKLAAMGALTLT